MAHLLRVVEVATGASEVVLHEWSVAEGEAFDTGDVLATLETDKAVVDIEAESGGVLVKRLVSAGERADVGAPLALLAAPEERVTDVAAELRGLGVDAPTASCAAEEPGQPAPATDQPEDAAGDRAGRRESDGPVLPERIFASPLARRMAREAGVPVEDLVGTGPGGRIVKRDVRAAMARRTGRALDDAEARTTDRAAAVTKPTPAYVDSPHSSVRRATAARLSESKRSAPHFYLRGSVRVDALLALRRQLAEAEVKVSLNDLVVRAVALAHARVPEMNVIWMPDAVRSFSSVDIAIAVATERGLLTPVVHGADTMPLPALAAASADLVDRARRGLLRQHELEGGSITVTNLGMFGVEEFSAIINPPHSAILAVGAVRPEPVADEGVVAVRSVMRLGLAVDHRPVDGAVAAQWLRVLVQNLEEPLRLML
jgi:pyruvate dehydrogenase E2 component (dihydrolipoamide acetyltransferase)